MTDGQGGAPIQMHNGNIMTDDNYHVIGIHSGHDKGLNYGTLISKLMFLDYIIPTSINF